MQDAVGRGRHTASTFQELLWACALSALAALGVLWRLSVPQRQAGFAMWVAVSGMLAVTGFLSTACLDLVKPAK